MAKTLDETYTALLTELPAFSKQAADIFEKMGWQWYDGCPTAERIEGVASDLLWAALKEATEDGVEHANASTGRIRVTLNKYTHGWVGQLSLDAICHTR